MTTVYVAGSRLQLDPSQAIGKGGEADVFQQDSRHVIKLFKQPNHPDFQGNSVAQQAARQRIDLQQYKLQEFPPGLPARVVTPQALVTDQKGLKILGYQMPMVVSAEVLLRYAERKFREPNITNQDVTAIFQDLYRTVVGIHQHQVVIGDFNDLNVLIRGHEAYLIDADSFQFGRYPCLAFTERFGDPTLMRAKSPAEKAIDGGTMILVSPHTVLSDWYAFTVLLFRSLLYADPYGGIYQPKDPKLRVAHPERPLHRISVFNPEVKYPKPAIPFKVLPDEMLGYLEDVFTKDRREVFPEKLLQLHWTACSQCGQFHARPTCPYCLITSPTVIVATQQVKGQVVATRIFKTPGTIIFATAQNGVVRWLYHQSDSFRREDGRVVLHGGLSTNLRIRIQGDRTLLGQNGSVVTLDSDGSLDRLGVDSYGSLPIFDANGNLRVWIQNGTIFRDTPSLPTIARSPTQVGTALANQTLLWLGPTFGFGFFRAGLLTSAFVFEANGFTLNDSVNLPVISGQLVDSTAVFTDHLCWFLATLRQNGVTKNICTVIGRDGTIKTSVEAPEGDGSWLGTIRGKCAAGDFLFSPTDLGIVRVQLTGNQIAVAPAIAGTESYVSADTTLCAGRDGIYAVNTKEVWRLTTTTH